MLQNCVMCRRKGTIENWRGTYFDTHYRLEHETTAERCSACKELYFSLEECAELDRQSAMGLVARGIRTGNEFWKVRSEAGLTAVEVALLLDVRPETISRWEKGHAELPRSAAFILAELYERPRVTRDKLERLAQPVEVLTS